MSNRNPQSRDIRFTIGVVGDSGIRAALTTLRREALAAGSGMATAFRGVNASLDQLRLGVTALTGVLGAGGLVLAFTAAARAAKNAVDATAQAADDQIKTARAVGLSLQEFRRLEFALSQGGIGGAQARRFLVQLARRFREEQEDAAKASRERATAVRNGVEAQRQLNQAERETISLRQSLDGTDDAVMRDIQRRISETTRALSASSSLSVAERTALETQRRALLDAARSPEAARRLLSRLLTQAEQQIPRLQSAIDGVSRAFNGDTNAATRAIDQATAAEDRLRRATAAVQGTRIDRINLLRDERAEIERAFAATRDPAARAALRRRSAELTQAIANDGKAIRILQGWIDESAASYNQAAGSIGAGAGAAQGNSFAQSIQETAAQARGLIPNLEALSDQLASLPDDAARSARLVELLGDRGAQLVSALGGGAEGLRELFRLSDRLQGPGDDALSRAAEEYNDRKEDLLTAARGLREALLGPLLQPLAEAFQQTALRLAGQREQIADLGREITTRYAPAIQDIFRLLSGGEVQTDFGRDLRASLLGIRDAGVEVGEFFRRDLIPVFRDIVIPAVREIDSFVRDLIQRFNDLTGSNATLGQVAILVVLGKILGVFGLIRAAVGIVASTISGVISLTAAAVRGIASLAANAGRSAAGAIAAARAGREASQAAFEARGLPRGAPGSVPPTGPAGGVGPRTAPRVRAGGLRFAGAVGRGAGALALGAAGAASAPVAAIIGAAALAFEVYRNWEPIKQAAQDAWTWISARADEAWEATKQAASSAWTWACERAREAWDGVGEMASSTWSSVRDGAAGVWSYVRDTGANAWEGITSAASSAWQSAQEGAAALLDRLRGGFASLRDYVSSIWSSIRSGAADLASRAASALPGFATGGRVRGPGTSTSDSIVARLSNGEFVVRAAAVQRYGTDFLDAINSMRLGGFAAGGPVGSVPLPAAPIAAGSRNLTLVLDGQQFGVSASEDVLSELERMARRRTRVMTMAPTPWMRGSNA